MRPALSFVSMVGNYLVSIVLLSVESSFHLSALCVSHYMKLIKPQWEREKEHGDRSEAKAREKTNKPFNTREKSDKKDKEM